MSRHAILSPLWIAILAALGAAGTTRASTPPAAGQEWNFRVLLDGREIGWHRYRVRGGTGGAEVDSEARFDVRFLLINAYRYRHEARERWRGPCLDELVARTETNGSVEETAAEARHGSLVVRGRAGEATHRGCVMSFAYWNPGILDANHLLNAQTGELLPVRVVDHGTERVAVAGRSVAADRHRLSAPGLEIDLWYADGRWVGLQAPTAGGRELRYELVCTEASC